MLSSLRGMPWPVAAFLAYGFLILAGVGLSLGPIVEQAVGAPLTFTGLVAMALLAYAIFTITLVLQRKAAARGFALGLASLTLPAIPLAVLANLPLVAAFLAVLAVLLIRGLRSAATRDWLSEP